MLGKTNDRVYAYTLSTAWDISTMSYASSYFSTASQETTPHSLQFKPDGTKMYVAGESSNKMHQYSLSTAWDLSTVSYDSVYFANTAQNSTQLLCTVFSTDGTKLFALNENGQKMVFKYNLSTAWNIGTASYANESFLLSSQDNTPTAIRFKDDGTRMYMVGTTTNIFFQYTTESVSAPAAKYHPAITKDSGQINSTYWTDINTMTTDQINGNGTVSYAVSTDNHTTWKIAKNGVGIRSIAKNNSGTWQYNSNGTYGSETWTNGTTNTELATLQQAMLGATFVLGYDVSTSVFVDSFSVNANETAPTGLAFNTDGTKMFVCGSTGDDVNEYALSTGFDISTASFTDAFSVASQASSPQGIAFNNNGTKMYIITNTPNDFIYQYTLSTGFDVSTASYASLSFNVGSQEASPRGIAFNANGTKVFIVGTTNDSVYEYALSTAFNISTASYTATFSVSSQDNAPMGLTFNPDGTKMFIAGQQGSDINEYTLSTGFDISTSTFVDSFSVISQDESPQAIAFNADGSKMFVLGLYQKNVHEYTMGTTAYTNLMDETQLEAVTDPNHFALGTTLDLMIAPYMATASASLPSSDGVSINYDAAALNKGAILGTDYDYDFPANNKVRITSLASQNLKVRVV